VTKYNSPAIFLTINNCFTLYLLKKFIVLTLHAHFVNNPLLDSQVSLLLHIFTVDLETPGRRCITHDTRTECVRTATATDSLA
jgi:hypothetical protein